MLSLDQQAALVARYKARNGLIIVRSAGIIGRIWDELGSWDRNDVARFAELAAETVAAARQAAVTLAAGFYSTILETPPPPVAAERIATVWNPDAGFTATWHALAEGRLFDEAVASGRSATDAQVSRFVTSTGRRTGDHVIEATRSRVLWRRVPDADACPFCVRAAGQFYKTSETADFGHSRCSCTAVPVAA